MRLILKFNLVFIVVFLGGLAAAGYVSWTLLQQNARDEIVQNACRNPCRPIRRPRSSAA